MHKELSLAEIKISAKESYLAVTYKNSPNARLMKWIRKAGKPNKVRNED